MVGIVWDTMKDGITMVDSLKTTTRKITFRPLKALINVALFLFICFNAPWYVSVAAFLLAVDFEFEVKGK